MAEIKFKCTNCDFAFTDKNLIFYLNSKLEDLESLLNSNSEDLELYEESLNKENSDKMTTGRQKNIPLILIVIGCGNGAALETSTQPPGRHQPPSPVSRTIMIFPSSMMAARQAIFGVG